MTSVALPELVMPDDPRYQLDRFTGPQAAAYLSVSNYSLYRAVAAERLSCFVLNVTAKKARYRFSQADLDAYRASRRREAKPVKGVRMRPTTAPPPRPDVHGMQWEGKRQLE